MIEIIAKENDEIVARSFVDSLKQAYITTTQMKKEYYSKNEIFYDITIDGVPISKFRLIFEYMKKEFF